MSSLNISDIRDRTVQEHELLWEQESQPAPEVGQLWLFSWDNNSWAMGIISSVYAGYIRALPVTLLPPAQEEMLTLAFTVPSIRGDLALWPLAETGLGTFLLTRCLGAALSERQINLIRGFVYDGHEAPLPLSHPALVGQSPRAAETLKLFQRLCFIQWPDLVPGDAVLDQQAFRDRNIQPQDISSLLGLSTGSTLALWTGKAGLTAEYATILSSTYGLSFAEMSRVPEGAEMLQLQLPTFKAQIVHLAELLHSDERSSRNAVRAEFALAARATGENKTIDYRLRSALNRLIEAHSGTSGS